MSFYGISTAINPLSKKQIGLFRWGSPVPAGTVEIFEEDIEADTGKWVSYPRDFPLHATGDGSDFDETKLLAGEKLSEKLRSHVSKQVQLLRIQPNKLSNLSLRAEWHLKKQGK